MLPYIDGPAGRRKSSRLLAVPTAGSCSTVYHRHIPSFAQYTIADINTTAKAFAWVGLADEANDSALHLGPKRFVMVLVHGTFHINLHRYTSTR